MRTGNIMEAMQAAKNGAKVRPARNELWCKIRKDSYPQRLCWLNYKGEELDDVSVGAVVAEAAFWEIDDQPRRWPSIVEAVKHMKKTGDWGKPVRDDQWAKLCPYGMLVESYSSASDGWENFCLSYKDMNCEWETKPAEAS